MDVKKDFPVLERKVKGKKLVYLDSAATSLTPQQVIDKIKHYYENINANVHRGMHEMSEEATIAYEEAHAKIATMIGTSMEQVVFTKNCTEALNITAYSLCENLNSGDNVVVTAMEHHSNFAPWQKLAKSKNFELRIVNINDDGFLDMNDFDRKVDEDTAVVSAVHVSNFLGMENPISEISKIAKENNSLFVLDAAQSIPHMEINVENLGADIIAFSGHKMLGPSGTGVLWGKKNVLESIQPAFLGGGMVREITYENARWEDLPWKLEAGTPNISGGIALGEAANYLMNTGLEKIKNHDEKLTKACLEILEDYGAKIYGISPKTSLVSFNVKGLHSHDVSTVLNEEGIAIRGGHHCVMPLHKKWGLSGSCRASFYLYNDDEDVEALHRGLKKVKEVLK